MPYSKLFYHVIWATKNREPLIDDEREQIIRSSFERTCSEMNLPLFGCGIVSDHVHLALTIPPSMSIADVVARLKGASSRRVTLQPSPLGEFKWQAEYGVISLTEKSLPNVLEYLKSQKQRHAEQRLINALEHFD